MNLHKSVFCIVLGLACAVSTDATENNSKAKVASVVVRSNLRSIDGRAPATTLPGSLYALNVGPRAYEIGFDEIGFDASAVSRKQELDGDALDRNGSAQLDAAQPQQGNQDAWLMLLAGTGLVVLQLRRKQKTLPQRPLIGSDNNVFGGRQAHRRNAGGELVIHS